MRTKIEHMTDAVKLAAAPQGLDIAPETSAAFDPLRTFVVGPPPLSPRSERGEGRERGDEGASTCKMVQP
jgi:hypothetical protein